MSEAPIKSTDITLYVQAAHGPSQRVSACLDFKGLEFNLIYVDPARPQPLGASGLADGGRLDLPVLRIGNQWLTDPLETALWLERRYPRPSLLGDTAQRRLEVLSLVHWAERDLTPLLARDRLDGDRPWDWLLNGWQLGQVQHRSRRLPWWSRLLWPVTMRQATVGAQVPVGNMGAVRERIAASCLARLGRGPFLGGLEAPSLADLWVYPLLLTPHALGLRGRHPWLSSPELLAWMRAVQAHLPANPLLVPEDWICNPPPG